ncbi:hypothetical protein [Acinetobacter sp. TUM15064]|uniref:hypothetical protein n=1 Tax=Acinetobacter sp. TUM15064 TaxID=2609134 RepID=UPI00124C8F1D|nr:hypothetical protein [Acinetobacter sp. TUM15064]
MGGSSSQTIGQRYFAKLTNFIGNPIEKLIGINFDNRGWLFKPDNGESFLRVESPNLYGDKEGGVAGFIDIHTGTADQLPNATYSADFSKVSGYPFQSYLLFRGLGKKTETTVTASGVVQSTPKHYNNSFYHGNSGYMKEMLLWPMRIHVRNDGRLQWYDEKAEINKIRVEIDPDTMRLMTMRLDVTTEAGTQTTVGRTTSLSNWRSELVDRYAIDSIQLSDVGSAWNSSTTNPVYKGNCVGRAQIKFSEKCEFIFRVFFHTDSSDAYPYTPKFSVEPASEILSSSYETGVYGTSHEYIFKMAGGEASIVATVEPHLFASSSSSNRMFPFNVTVFYPNNYQSQLTKFGEINPIHKIREILTDDTAMNKPESDVNDVNFKKAADRIFDEGLGISWAITDKSCIEAINELCGHIEAGVRINRQTGIYEMVLFRDDWFADDEIHTLPVNKIKSMQLDGAVSADELINQLNVSHYNRDAIKSSSFSVAENAAIRNLQGLVNSEDVKFPYYTNQRNAAVVAQWKLKQMSTPVWQGTLTTGFYEARKWNRYDLLKLAWPKRWNGTILVRIMKINLGTGTEVSIDFVEVVPYSNMLSSNIVIDTPVDTTPKPPQPALFKAFELSYLEAVQLNGQKAVDDALAYNPDGGYVACIAQRPQSNSLSALLYTDQGNDYERTATIAYCETVELDQNISPINSAFIVRDAGEIDMVSTGTQITVNNEIMVYQSYDQQTGLLTVKRGAFDTIPQNHLVGSVLYFADDFVAVDPTEYVIGEIINVKALTTTPSGILNIDDVDPQPVEIQVRAIRPYPPANVKMNDAYFPETTVISNDIVLTWVHRNRLQQTGGEILGFYEGGVTLETGVTYSIEISANDTVLHHATEINANSYVIPSAVLIQNKAHRLRIWSVRDSYTSFSVFEHSFFVESASLILTATTDGKYVSGNTVPIANITINVDESLTANLSFDGTGISGKAEPGATITIEIEE